LKSLNGGAPRSRNGTGHLERVPTASSPAGAHPGKISPAKILIASSICPEALAELQRDHDVDCAFNADEETLRRLIAGREVLVFRSGVNITAEVMACSPNLKLLLRAGSGLDNLDLAYVEAHGIRLVRIPEPGAQAVAELTFALMLALARQVLTADQLLRRGTWAKGELKGWSLAGKVLGIAGAGSIGTRVGQMGVAWGMEVVGCVKHPSPSRAARMADEGIRLASLEEVLAAADFLAIHVPRTPATLGLIGAEALARMKTGAFLVNAARGGIVDEAALREALVSGKLRGAGLDVHAAEGPGKISPLADLPNVVLTPHIGASTVDAQREIGRRVIDAVTEFARRPGEYSDGLPAPVRPETAAPAAGAP
jgi:D-3-phosphoglycerate dehydrogenase